MTEPNFIESEERRQANVNYTVGLIDMCYSSMEISKPGQAILIHTTNRAVIIRALEFYKYSVLQDVDSDITVPLFTKDKP